MPRSTGNSAGGVRLDMLGRGFALVGAVGVGAGSISAGAEPLADDPWSLETGDASLGYQVPTRYEKAVIRTLSNPKNEPRNSHARTPHQTLEGMITRMAYTLRSSTAVCRTSILKDIALSSTDWSNGHWSSRLRRIPLSNDFADFFH